MILSDTCKEIAAELKPLADRLQQVIDVHGPSGAYSPEQISAARVAVGAMIQAIMRCRWVQASIEMAPPPRGRP